jgi:hypothetical protein
MAVLARREPGGHVGERDHVVRRGRRQIGGLDDAGRVIEQMVKRDRGRRAADR